MIILEPTALIDTMNLMNLAGTLVEPCDESLQGERGFSKRHSEGL